MLGFQEENCELSKNPCARATPKILDMFIFRMQQIISMRGKLRIAILAAALFLSAIGLRLFNLFVDSVLSTHNVNWKIDTLIAQPALSTVCVPNNTSCKHGFKQMSDFFLKHRISHVISKDDNLDLLIIPLFRTYRFGVKFYPTNQPLSQLITRSNSLLPTYTLSHTRAHTHAERVRTRKGAHATLPCNFRMGFILVLL
jgi:hypothetical protein